jgi:hypothetical protein
MDEDAMVSTGGSLKLKSKPVKTKEKKDKKSKKKGKKDKKRPRTEELAKEELIPIVQATMTASEVKFIEKRRKQEEVRLGRASSKSHREKVAGEMS